jgi:uncharacterized protein DUF2071
MRLPIIRGLIDRRILLNYRIEPSILAAILPPPFRPQLVAGQGLAGICLIRLCEVRPRGAPSCFGIRSENAAHRVAVEWDEAGQTRSGVFVLRRDTNSRLNALAGGRVFPGIHHLATFRVQEEAKRYHVRIRSNDDEVAIDVAARSTDRWPEQSVFASLEQASAFFEAGSIGYSPAHQPGAFQGLELRCQTWDAQPLAVERAQSSFFDNEQCFPRGSVRFDSALLMRGIEHEWHQRDDLCCVGARSHPVRTLENGLNGDRADWPRRTTQNTNEIYGPILHWLLHQRPCGRDARRNASEPRAACSGGQAAL